MKRKLLLSLLLALNVVLSGQNQIRVMSYNLLNYPNNHDVNFKKIITQINPDALVVVEMISQTGINEFLNHSLSVEYSAAAVNIQASDAYGNNGNDCGFYYKSNILTLIEYKAIPARTRVISEFKLVHNITKDTLIIFGVHLKAYPEPDNQTKRLSTVNTLRTRTLQLKPTTNYIVAGDFNIFTSTEPAFLRLLDQSSPGYFYDPQNAVGDWTDNQSFAFTHTYSPSYLKSRLDMILVSKSLNEKGGADLVDYKIFGNDGNHFAKSITNGYNSWFSDISIGNALISASDHLPVYADFLFGVTTDVTAKNNNTITFELNQNYPNPFNPTTVISYQLPVRRHVQIRVFDLLGREVATLVNEEKEAGTHQSTFNTQHTSLSSGIYFYQLKAGALVLTKKMVLLR